MVRPTWLVAVRPAQGAFWPSQSVFQLVCTILRTAGPITGQAAAAYPCREGQQAPPRPFCSASAFGWRAADLATQACSPGPLCAPPLGRSRLSYVTGEALFAFSEPKRRGEQRPRDRRAACHHPLSVLLDALDAALGRLGRHAHEERGRGLH